MYGQFLKFFYAIREGIYNYVASFAGGWYWSPTIMSTSIVKECTNKQCILCKCDRIRSKTSRCETNEMHEKYRTIIRKYSEKVYYETIGMIVTRGYDYHHKTFREVVSEAGTQPNRLPSICMYTLYGG